MKKLITILALTCQISASNGMRDFDEVALECQASFYKLAVEFSNSTDYRKSIKQMNKTKIGDSQQELRETYEDFINKREKFLEELADRMLKYSFPGDANDPNIQNLLTILNLGDKKVEVRFVGPENIINLCNSDERKDQYLKLLRSEASLKENFSNGYNFEDGNLEENILSAIEEGCGNNVFRDVMVCFLALTAKQGFKQMRFKQAKDDESRLKGMTIEIGKDDVLIRSLFKGKNSFSKEGSNIFFVRTALKFILFHEFGHKINTLFNNLNLVDLRNTFGMSDNYKFGINMFDDDDICNILPSFISFSLDEKKLGSRVD